MSSTALRSERKSTTLYEELQQDVDEWLLVYNNQRPHSWQYCYGKTPMQIFGESKHLAGAKLLDKQIR